MPNGTYTVTLKFAEIYLNAAGQRKFDVAINGTTVLTNFDVFAAAGGKNIAHDRSFTVSVTNGALTIAFTNVVDNAKVSAIAIEPVGGAPAPTQVRVRAGSTAYADALSRVWSADTGFSGGTTSTTTAAVGATADQPLYQTERYGNFSYNLAVPNGPYLVTLKFAETWFNNAGQRTFNVTINGTTVLQNFDILAAAGGKNIAVDRAFPATVTNGTLTVGFTGVIDNAKVNALEVRAAPTTTASFVYRGDGLRHSRTVGGATTTYTWDRALSLPVVLQDSTTTYVYGLGGALISQTDGTGVQSYVLSDGLGSTRALTDASGNPTATFDYDVFGALRSSTGTSTTEFRFAGQQDEPALGYQYLRARYYDPTTGRFISMDPVKGLATVPGTQHPYAYALNSPANFTDPTGEFVDVFADVAFIAYDLYRLGADNLFGDCDNLDENLTALGLDVGASFVPGLTGAGVASRSVRVTQRAFAPGKWLRHFEDHGSEFGYKTAVEYLRGAQRLSEGGRGVKTFTRSNGDKLFYRESTNEFAAVNKNDVIKTYFKPVTGSSYWQKQTGGT